jgi:hypothetical protein
MKSKLFQIAADLISLTLGIIGIVSQIPRWLHL